MRLDTARGSLNTGTQQWRPPWEHCSHASCIWQLFLGVWVLLVEHGTLDFLEMTLSVAQCGLTLDTGLNLAWKNFTYFLRRRGLGFGRFLLQNGEVCSVMLRFEPLHALFALGVQTLFLRVHELDPV